MKIIKLIRCEFIKNFSLKKYLIACLVLCLSCFLLIKLEGFLGDEITYTDPLSSIESFNEDYKKALETYKDDPNLINQGIVEVFKKMKPSYENAYNLIGETAKYTWQRQAINILELEVNSLVALRQLLDNYDDSLLRKSIEDSDGVIYSGMGIYNMYKSDYKSSLHRYADYKKDDIKKELDSTIQVVELLEQSLKENAYYLYKKSMYVKDIYLNSLQGKEIEESSKELYEYIIDNKIIDEKDYRNKNALQHYRYSHYKVEIPNSKQDLMNPISNDYDTNINFYKKLIDINANNQKIVDYAYKNELKHDIYSPDDNMDEKYLTSKQFMNQGLHLGFVVMLLMVILNSGIMSKEHDNGTIKLLLTTPIKRTKILLSKLLYLIIETYLLWIIASVIMFVMVGIMYGFNDLFTPKLIVLNDQVVQVNYILWYLKEMLICMIPICFYLVLMLTLSTISLNTALTASIMSIISIFSITIWMLIANFGMVYLSVFADTPIPYLDFWFVRYRSEFYLKAISSTTLGYNYGIWISILFGIVIFILLLFIYRKKDIKN